MNGFKRILSLFLCLTLCIPLLSGCRKEKEEEPVSDVLADEYPVTVEGTKLSAMPERVVVLSDSLADVILALGYEIVLKGKSSACTQEELASLPNVSMDDLNGLRSLRPDLILTDEEPANAADLAIEGIPVIAIPPAQSRADFERLYMEVGAALRGKTTGAAFGADRARSIFTSVDDITRSSPSTTILMTACYLLDAEGNAATGDTLPGVLLSAAGVANAFESTQTGSITAASLKVANPNFIFCPEGLKETLLANEDYSDLIAVKNGDIYEMDPVLMTRQGTTVIRAVQFMHDVIFANWQPPQTSSGGTSSGTLYAPVKYGDVSDDVMRLQQRLDELGYMPVEPTGEFGDITEQAIMNFQLFNDMSATGVADQKTLEAIYSDSAIPYSEDN